MKANNIKVTDFEFAHQGQRKAGHYFGVPSNTLNALHLKVF